MVRDGVRVQAWRTVVRLDLELGRPGVTYPQASRLAPAGWAVLIAKSVCRLLAFVREVSDSSRAQTDRYEAFMGTRPPTLSCNIILQLAPKPERATKEEARKSRVTDPLLMCRGA